MQPLTSTPVCLQAPISPYHRYAVPARISSYRENAPSQVSRGALAYSHMLRSLPPLPVVDKASYRALTRPFPFPLPGLRKMEVNGFQVCRIPSCKHCALAPESVAFHFQCFKTFIKEYGMSLPQVINYLWTIACHRRPWSQTPALGLAPCRQLNQNWVARISHDSELAGLRSIPEELLDIIRQFSPHSHLWRFVALLALTPRPISTLPPHTLALASIDSWRRGDREVVCEGDKRPIIKITIDSNGIHAIERLPGLPKVNLESSRHRVYIVEESASLAGVQACVQVCSPAPR